MAIFMGNLIQTRMFEVGDVIQYLQMAVEENTNLQQGMNYRLKGKRSIFLMNKGKSAHYEDTVEDEGHVIIYEGHDVPKSAEHPHSKEVDQPYSLSSGKLSQNGKFYEAAIAFKKGERTSERIRVYEKIRPGLWTYDGLFDLIDAWIQDSGKRNGNAVLFFAIFGGVKFARFALLRQTTVVFSL